MEEKGRGPPKGGGQSSGRAGANWKPALPGADDEDSAQVNTKRFAEVDKINEMDNQMGFGAFAVGPPRMGWMINMAQTYVKDPEWPGGRSAVDYYFLQEDGEYFKTTLVASPYFFVKCKMGTENVVEDALRKRFEKAIELVERVEKEDLDFPNHLAGLKRSYLKLSFRNVSDLDKVRRVLMPIAIRQGENYQDGVIPMSTEADSSLTDGRHKKGAMGSGDPHANALSNIVDLREHDIPYALRVSIDYNICVGLWYTVRAGAGGQRAQITVVREKDVRPDPVILAYDIETSKSPLKFPDSAVDPIMMISYMINGQGFLITNRDIVSQDIEDFEYTPKPDYPGNFTVFNEPDESALLRRFFSHIQQTRPTVMVTYNGDFFDFPYVETRALVHGMDMEAMIGFKKNNQGDYWSTHCLHLDCYRWVKRDSYLPAGSQGLKAVTSAKLGYDPLELDPELMTPLASSDPQTLANYSVSDAVATFYLYMKYVHPFIFSLCNIIPLNPDDVLRKGSGTLCETLLMAEAFRANVVMPNKHADGKENFYAGHLVETETYIGGHVEALEAGVFRADIPYKFRLDPECLETLIKDLDRALTFSLQAEGGIQDLDQVTNYDEIKEEIKGRLEMLRDNPHRNDQPLIYHLDVAAMYPNIILSNRLQPTAIVDEATCAQCDHNRPGKACQRTMTWSWRGEVYTAKKNEYRMIKAQLESEQFPAPVNPRFNNQPNSNGPRMVPYHGLPEADQKTLLHKRLAEYSQKVYRRVRKTEVVQRDSIVCQKEHAFYIDTVKAFRDRRYDYKGLHKKAKKMLDDAISANDVIKIEECKKLVVLYDSLQLAHKCILNSFYGYVMRKGARWYSMEMAGIVCATGASIIQLARQTVERIGRPLELDTDGIWAMLPWDFPQGYTFKLVNGKQHAFDYPCVMLNHQVHDMFTNDQYHTLVDPVARTYKQSSENSIFFEIDGPYRAMIIPSSTEEGKLLKKRYAVFNHNGSLAELKGFEVKRRGELKFLKVFQTQIFKVYLEGGNLAECYGKVAEVADYWLDILHGHGKALEDHDLVDLISENRSMSKSLEEYGEQKSTSISTAKRLAEFLGDAMVKEKGLACKFVISSKPQGIPVAQRAIPLAIFSAEEPVKKHYLRKWLKDPGMIDFDMRSIIDWSYYLERLGSMIQKLIVIPAALQAVPNPVARVPAPDWLLKKDKNGNGLDAKVQAKITDVFKKGVNRDIEDLLKPSTKAQQVEDPEPEEATPTPTPTVAPVALMETDYAAWIAGTKAHWRHLRESLGDRLNSAVTSTTTTTNKSAFGRLAEHDKDLVTRTPWQIVSVETLEPGEFKLWVLLSSSPQPRSFRLSMMRTLYFHLSCSLESLDEAESLSALLHRVYRKLPSGEDAQFLYEFSLSESTFQEHFYRFASLTQLPNLLGVYEDDVPLELMALASLGACASVKSDVRRHRDAHSRYELDDLAFCSTTDVPYLTKDNLQYVSVLQFASDTRQLILLGLPGGRMRLLIVEPGMRRQLPSNLRSLLPSEITTGDLIIEADMFPDQAAAQKSIIRSLTELVDARTGPVIVLQHSSIYAGRTATPLGLHELNLPVLVINSLPDVSSETLFPALDWQRSVGRRALAHQLAIGPWLEHRLSLARYSHLPLGFLLGEEDSSVYARVADVFFTRALRRAGHLLWYNHGSTEKASLVKADSTVSHESDEAPPSQKCSGLFRTVCVEADLTGLAINAVMEHASIAAEDQAIGATIVADAGGIGLSSASSHSSLLAIVKKLLTGWLKDHVQNGQEHAQHLATGLHSWLQASSHLHSPSLARRLRSLLNRSLGLLVARLHSFGCQVVHIDSSRIVVRTTRQERAAAFALLEWIQRELKKQDAFCWIDFTPVRFWQVLLWMDAANYHGLAFTAPVDQEECQEASEEETTWLMEWSLAEYLPPALQPIFKRLVQEFIHRATTSRTAAEVEPALRRESLIPSTEKPDEAEEENVTPGDSEFAQLFLRVLREAQKYFFSTNLQDDCTERCFPPLVGSRLAAIHGPNHPVPRAALLEFVKACGAVFSLDVEHPRQSEHLMKLAHGLLGIRSFADETVWRMPAPTLLLPDIICPACTRTANLDLCRDLAVAGSKPCCRVCGHLYDPADLEAALTTQLTRLISSYLSQDLVCKHCPPGVGLKADHMQPICLRCASPFHLATIKSDQVKEHVQILKRLAPVLGMSALSCYLSNLSI